MPQFGLSSANNNSTLDTSINNIDKSTPFIAASDGNLELLQKSLQVLGQKITVQDENGFSILHAASSYNQLHIMKWILECSSEINITNIQDSDGDTPLHHCESAESAKFLVEEGKADVSVKNKDGLTPLESKLKELEEIPAEDYDSDDEDQIQLKGLIEYFQQQKK